MAKHKLTKKDIKQLQDYLAELNEIQQREPERLPTAVWDEVWPQIQSTGEVPAEYTDRIGVNEITVKGKPSKGYYDIVWEQWNSEKAAVEKKYHDLIIKAFMYAVDMDIREDAAPQPLTELLQRLIDKITADPNTDDVIKNNQLANFLTIRQDKYFNELTKFTRSLPGENMTIDEIMHIGTINGEYVELQTPLTQDNSTAAYPWTVSTSQLFDRLIVEFTQTGSKDRTITLSLTDYMQSRGLKDRKETRKQVKADLQTIRHNGITFTTFSGEGKKRKETAFVDVNIAEAVGIDKKGMIMLRLTPSIYEVIKRDPVMPLPPECQKINSKRNPNSYNLLRKIAEHKNMNMFKPNEDIISVATLLKCCPAIPSYDKVMKSDRRVTDRIIDPFMRDMDALKTINWEFCGTNNEPLTDRDTVNFTYEVFIKCNVHITWNEYPDQTARLEKYEAAKAEKTKKRGRKQGGNGQSTGG